MSPIDEHWLIYSSDEKPELPVEPLGAMNGKWAQEWRDVGARVEGPFVSSEHLHEAVLEMEHLRQALIPFAFIDRAAMEPLGLADAYDAVREVLGLPLSGSSEPS